jgi:hypothetical protein
VPELMQAGTVAVVAGADAGDVQQLLERPVNARVSKRATVITNEHMVVTRADLPPQC